MLGISFTFHIVGVVFWVGGLLFLTRQLKSFSDSSLQDNAALRSVRMGWHGFLLPGLGLVLISGLYQLALPGISFYMKQGWFHGKLTAVIVLIVVTALLGVEVKKVSGGQLPLRTRLSVCHGLSSAMLILIVALTYLGRGV